MGNSEVDIRQGHHYARVSLLVSCSAPSSWMSSRLRWRAAWGFEFWEGWLCLSDWCGVWSRMFNMYTYVCKRLFNVLLVVKMDGGWQRTAKANKVWFLATTWRYKIFDDLCINLMHYLHCSYWTLNMGHPSPLQFQKAEVSQIAISLSACVTAGLEAFYVWHFPHSMCTCQNITVSHLSQILTYSWLYFWSGI